MESIAVVRPSELDELVSRSVSRAVEKALREFSKPTEPKAWLSNAEAMELLSLSRPTLARYRKDGKLPYSRIGSNVYYRRTDVEALLESNLQPA